MYIYSIYIIYIVYLYIYLYIYVYIYIYTFNLKLLTISSRVLNICGTRKCDLCLCKKLLIARANSTSLLNKCDELVLKCLHMNKFTLKCF